MSTTDLARRATRTIGVCLLLVLAPAAAAVTPTGSVGSDTITRIAGDGTPGFAGDGGPATLAKLGFGSYVFNIGALATDRQGAVYIVANERVRKVDPAGTIRTIAGTGVLGQTGDGGPATAATLLNPNAIAVDAAGNIYLADGGLTAIVHKVRKIRPDGTIVTVAGGGAAFSGDGVPATSIRLQALNGLAVDAAGNLYLIEGAAVRKVDAAGTITTIAGDVLAGGFSGDGGPATAARLSFPDGLAVDPHGNVYVSEYGSNRVRKIDTAGTITTFAGSAVAGTGGDGGPAASASLAQPLGVAADPFGNVYIVTAGRIRKVDTAGTIATLAGAGTNAADGLAASASLLAAPFALATDQAGSVYFGEFNLPRVRKIWAKPLPALPASGGPATVPLQRVPHGKGLRVQVQLRVPVACGKGCVGRAELRLRSGRATYPQVALPGDGPTVFGTRHGIRLGGHGGRIYRFTITISRSKLLRTRFTTHGGFRVADTRLRIWFTRPGGEVLLVRDGQLKISIAKIKSGALPGLRGIL